MKTNTIALIVSCETGPSVLLDTLCDANEIRLLEAALEAGQKNPMQQIYQHREVHQKQENEFEDYVEELLSQPFLAPEIQQHGVQWFRSRIKIEQYKKTEKQAAQTIAEYAHRIFQKDRSQTDFILASASSQVRVRIFLLSEVKAA